MTALGLFLVFLFSALGIAGSIVAHIVGMATGLVVTFAVFAFVGPTLAAIICICSDSL